MIVNHNDYRQVGNGAYGVGCQILNNQSFDQKEVNLVLGLLSKQRHNLQKGRCGAGLRGQYRRPYH